MFFRGYFSQGDERYFIEPLSSANQDEQEHALFKHDPDEKKAHSTCGMDDMIWAHTSLKNVTPPATSLVVRIPLFLFGTLSCTLMYSVLSALRSSLSNCTLLKLYNHC